MFRMTESDRLSFVESRDGLQGAIAFAKQGIHIYRRSVLQSAKRGYGVKGSAFADMKPHHASFREYRRTFIESYLAFKRYVAEHE
jgi:hypothetical protein